MVNKMSNDKIVYPSHKHPHGIDDVEPNIYRIWVCEECQKVFTDNEIRNNETKEWGHPCKLFPKTRCESHFNPYVPEIINKDGR